MKKTIDLLVLAMLVLSLLLMVQPFWSGGFQFGFFSTLLFTITHIFTSRLTSS